MTYGILMTKGNLVTISKYKCFGAFLCVRDRCRSYQSCRYGEQTTTKAYDILGTCFEHQKVGIMQDCKIIIKISSKNYDMNAKPYETTNTKELLFQFSDNAL